MKYKKFFITMLLISIIGAVITLVPPALIQYWKANNINIDNAMIYTLAGIIVASYLIRVLLIYVREKFALEFNKNNFFNSLGQAHKMQYDELTNRGPLNVLERIIMSVNSTYSFMTGDYINIWSNIIIILGALAILFKVNWVIALAMAVVLPINILGYKALNKKLFEKSKVMQEQTSAGWQKVLSFIDNVDDFKQLSKFSYIENLIDDDVHKIFKSMADVNVYAQSVSYIIHGFNEVVRSIIMLYMLFMATKGEYQAGVIMIVIFLIPVYFSAVSSIVSSNLNKRDYKVTTGFIDEVKSLAEANGKKSLDPVQNMEIDLDHIGAGEFLRRVKINETFNKGDIVWVKGDSGTGKSTLVKYLTKFRPIETIKYNGVDMMDLANEDLRERVIYLSQQSSIYNASILDNIIIDKNKQGQMRNKIENEKLLAPIFANKSVDTIINPAVANLSGGEKQRIAFARAIYRDPDVLILDEITSNIDDKSAREIYARVNEERNKRITFIISHDDLPGEISNKEINL